MPLFYFPLPPSLSLCLSLFITSYSFVFLQLHHSIWGAAVSQLPPGVRQQYALCVADHNQPWEPNQSGLQWPEHGETVWLPLHQGWGKGTEIYCELLSSALCTTSSSVIMHISSWSTLYKYVMSKEPLCYCCLTSNDSFSFFYRL